MIYRVFSTKYFDKLSNDEQKLLRAEFASAKKVIDFLADIVQEEIRGLENQELSKDNYDSPAFPYLMADMNGSKRAYHKVLNLISEVDKTDE